jgi:tRNA/tmRNA/rRNA uracil-C5-methylase (TrmA/RlmC/RlmD family)
MSITESHRPPPKFKPHPFTYHQELEVRIESLTNEGVGVARVDGWVVFIAFALPGELVKCWVFRNHKSYSEADLAEVIEPSSDRVQPVCALFGTCGGCQYQNLDYAEQLRWKQRQVAELLQRMAKIDFPVEPVVASPQQFGYRSKITPHFHRPKDGEVGAIGFLRAGTRSRIVDVPRCEIAMDVLNEKLGAVRDGVRAGALDFKNGATLLLRASEGGVLTRNDEKAAEVIHGMRLEFQAGDFFQNNPFILPAFVDHVITEATASGARFLIDAYCGSGLFGICAAPRFERVSGVEISETAVAKAKHNAQLNGLQNCDFLAADAQRIFASIAHEATESVVIVDPPRAGCSEDFLSQMFAYGPRAVVYVSCNPATQMRDLVRFVEAGYTLKKVQPFDLFPQTRHLECVMTFSRML